MRQLAATISLVPTAVRWLLTAGFVALIVVLSITPDRQQAGDTVFDWLVTNTSTWLQKVLHVLVYALLTAMLFWATENLSSRRLRIILALGAAVALGAALEWYQLRVPGRFGNLTDILLNSAGAIIGLVAALLLLKTISPA
jgi:VanZ family protein